MLSHTGDSRSWDVVVLGVGIYGKRAAVELLRHVRSARVAIAGRSPARLQAAHEDILARVAAATQQSDASAAGKQQQPQPSLGIVSHCEASDAAAMDSLAASTRVLLNCVSNYRAVGDTIVRACVTQGTHYFDLSIDTDVQRKWAERYGLEAEARGLLVVPCCGVDYMLADFGALLAARLIQPPAALVGLESVVEMMPIKVMREATFDTLMEVTAAPRGSVATPRAGNESAAGGSTSSGAAKSNRGRLLQWSSVAKCWTLPMLRGESEIVEASLAHLSECEPGFPTAVPYTARVALPSWRTALGMAAGLVLLTLARWGPARRVIKAVVPAALRRLGLLTNDLAAYEAAAIDSLQMRKLFAARGTAAPASSHADGMNRAEEEVVRVVEITAGSITAPAIALAAEAVLLEADSIHVAGFSTPAAAFHATAYWDKLVQRHGVSVVVRGSGGKPTSSHAKESKEE